MARYIARRLITIPLLLVAVSFAVYLIMQLMVGDGSFFLLGGDAYTSQALSLSLSAHEGYFAFLSRILSGDFGRSLQGFDVLSLILSRIAPTLSLAIFSLIFTLIFSLMAVYLSYATRSRVVRFIVDAFCLFSLSFPSFIVGFILLLIFSAGLSLLPVAGYVSFFESPFRFLSSLLLPSVTLGIMHSGFIIKLMKSSLSREMGKDYVRLALAKGKSRNAVLFHEAGANILPEVVTAIAQSFITFLCSSAAVEYVFSIPGLGSLVVSSIARRDIAVLEALVLLSALIVAIVNFLSDIAYALFDRRVVSYE